MKIRTMTAIFGKLDRARLELGDGLNLICAPNEGGKSTWCAFWQAMLYGFDTRERDRKGHLAEKNRYQPWSGAQSHSAPLHCPPVHSHSQHFLQLHSDLPHTLPIPVQLP